MQANVQSVVEGIEAGRLDAAVDRLINTQRPRYRRLWAYYRNPMRIVGVADAVSTPGCERPYRQAQEWGLPPRITGIVPGAEPFADAGVTGRSRKEIVIENDIGWRIDTMVEYLFGKSLVISSDAPETRRRELIGRLIDAIFEHNGGMQFFQQLAVAGAVYGFADVLVKLDVEELQRQAEEDKETRGQGDKGTGNRQLTTGNSSSKSSPDADRSSGTPDAAGSAQVPGPGGGPAPARSDFQSPDAGAESAADAQVGRIARLIRLEIVEPARALPFVSDQDWRNVEAYGQVWEKKGAGCRVQGSATTRSARTGWWERLRAVFSNDRAAAGELRGGRGQVRVVELITPGRWLRLEDGKIVARGVNSLGEIPLVHLQNMPEARSYSGASDVEPLIPLQDELNTRLSDRAHRITLQSFKMYLGKGMEEFIDQPVAPGRMWMTDNEQAQIVEFGGDSNCPSEESHISDLREALDKSSGVTPIAAGAIKNRIGRLTSAAALRITLLALLSKTDRKRALFGAGIRRMCALALKWLDVAGVFHTTEDERRIELAWPSPLPENEMEKLQEAEAKLRLGVEKEVVLRELGY